MNNSYTIKDLIELFLSKIWLIILVTILGGVAGFGVSKLLLPVKYSSHINMYVQSYTDIKDDNGQNDISRSKQLIGTYITLLGQDDYVMHQISDDLLKKFDEDTLKKCFSMDESGIKASALRESLSLTSVTDTSAITAVATTTNAEVSAAILQSLKDHANQIVSDAVGVGSITAVDTPRIYNTPVSPNTAKNTVLGMAAGLMLIILIVLISDFFDNTVKDISELEKKYNKAIIGQVQQLHSDKKKLTNEQEKNKYFKLTDEDIPFDIKESFKSIRTNVLFSLATSDQKIFAVTSANSGEGKSTMISNIAIALAQSGKKTILVDGDLRKNVLNHVFEIQNKIGLTTAICGEKDVDSCICKDVIENLDVLTSGRLPPNPSELLGSEQMGRIMDELSKKYDVVLIDLPPINVVSDGLEAAKYFKNILFVVRYNYTTIDDIEQAMKQIEFAQMHTLGFVLDGVKAVHHGKYYYRYKQEDISYDTYRDLPSREL